MNKNYDDTCPESIEKYGQLLEDKSLSSLYDFSEIKINRKNKGKLGQLVEEIHFGYDINSNKEADFYEAVVELKVVPLKDIKKKSKSKLLRERKGVSAKERMVLSIINYEEVAHEVWDRNTLFEKSSRLLLSFYKYEKDVLVEELIFDKVSLWSPSNEDMKVIEEDWKKIVEKIKNGKAHELSEGDTMYLSACTKGASAKSTRAQPFSNIPAKQRAFSFKRSYVDAIYEEILEKREDFKESKVSIIKGLHEGIEGALERVFKPYYGLSAYEIERHFKRSYNRESYSYLASLMKSIMNVQDESDIEEFKKANIQLKTARITPTGSSKESISFPSFKFKEIIQEDWEGSQIKTLFDDTKFLFAIFDIRCKTTSEFNKMTPEERSKALIFRGVKLWSMPHKDLLEVKEVWERTRKVINEGIEIKVVPYGKGTRRKNNLPDTKFNEVIHIRPHGSTAADTYPLPGGGEFTKQCFFLNAKYVAKILNTK